MSHWKKLEKGDKEDLFLRHEFDKTQTCDPHRTVRMKELITIKSEPTKLRMVMALKKIKGGFDRKKLKVLYYSCSELDVILLKMDANSFKFTWSKGPKGDAIFFCPDPVGAAQYSLVSGREGKLLLRCVVYLGKGYFYYKPGPGQKFDMYSIVNENQVSVTHIIRCSLKKTNSQEEGFFSNGFSASNFDIKRIFGSSKKQSEEDILSSINNSSENNFIIPPEGERKEEKKVEKAALETSLCEDHSQGQSSDEGDDLRKGKGSVDNIPRKQSDEIINSDSSEESYETTTSSQEEEEGEGEEEKGEGEGEGEGEENVMSYILPEVNSGEQKWLQSNNMSSQWYLKSIKLYEKKREELLEELSQIEDEIKKLKKASEIAKERELLEKNNQKEEDLEEEVEEVEDKEEVGIEKLKNDDCELQEEDEGELELDHQFYDID